MKWICWKCAAENPYHMLKSVQAPCQKCGDALKIGRAPLSTTTNIAGFLFLLGGLLWGFEYLVPDYLSLVTFGVLAVVLAVAVGGILVCAGLALYNRMAEGRHEEGRL